MNWYPNRLPNHEIPIVQSLIDKFDYDKLFQIMLKYRLTDAYYCCPEPSLVNHFKYIVDVRRK